MSATLPTSEACCLPACDSVVVQNVPGPAGSDGAAGLDGADGISAVTTLAADYTMPAEMASAQATVGTTSGLTIGQTVFVQSLGTLEVTAIASANLVTLKNIEDTTTGAYPANAAPGTIAPVGSRISPTGIQGPAGIITGTAAGGDLKGSYPTSIKLAIPNALGALAVGNGTDANSLSAGSNGQIPAYDSTQPLGIIPKSILPITGGTNVAADRVVRLSSATGTPIALGASKASIKDPGGLGVVVADASAGNARGVDAVDLQVNRPSVGATAVASGAQAVILGGEDNTANSQRAVVVGGQKNACIAAEAFIGGGCNHIIDSTQSTIAGGDTNTIQGGSANEAFIGGGNSNAITGNGQSVIGGGKSNSVIGDGGVVLGGFTNAIGALGAWSAIGGGYGNVVSASMATIPGGHYATADKFGQRAYGAGRFAAQADCQQSDLLWRIETTTSTANVEAFLDGLGLRATIPIGKTWAFDILVVGRSSAGASAAWTVKGVIQNNAGVTALVGTVTNALLADGTGATWGTLANVPVVDADNTNDSLRIRVTGALTTLIRWTAHARIMEVAY